MKSFFKSLPPSVVVLGGAGLVGGISAVLAVALYRDLTRNESAIPVESVSNTESD